MNANTPTDTSRSELTIRLLGRRDLPALTRLAGRDGDSLPERPALGALLDGELIAAIPLEDPEARPLADPFVATTVAVTLLRLRAAQLRGEDQPRRPHRPLWRLRGLRRPRARGAIVGSPPGGGSRLLQR